jgi:chromosome segregation ATPase
LDRRRAKAGSANAAAAKAQDAVTDIDRQLETVANLVTEQEQALRRAVQEADRLKRSLKAASKRRTELDKERRKAVAKADRAREQAAAAEAKYDKEVLADLVRREKEKDRAAAPSSDTPPPKKASAPAPEQPAESTQTAKRTAARKTAKAARLIR